MTLATTCPRCKTSFKVVADQLKLRRGMVRCGVCQTVFSGLEQLRYVEANSNLNPSNLNPSNLNPDKPPASADPRIEKSDSPDQNLTTDAPPKSSGVITAMFDNFAQDQASNRMAANEARPATRLDLDQVKISVNLPTNSPPSSIVVSQVPTRDDPRFKVSDHAVTTDAGSTAIVSTELTTTLLRQDEDLKTAFFLPDHWDATTVNGDANPPFSIQSANPVHVPITTVVDQFGNDIVEDREAQRVAMAAMTQFNRQDDAVDFFSSENSYGTSNDRFSHFTKILLTSAAAIALIFQLSLVARNWLAARVPSLTPVLSTLASAVGLQIESPRNIAALTIEGFEVQQTTRPDVLAVSALVRNRSSTVVQWPALELTLKSADGEVILRKILTPSEYLKQAPTNAGIAAASEQPIRIGLLTQGIVPAGYSAVLIYI